jgi:hypothetical protein
MARTSYQNIQALRDAAQTWNFDLFFPSVPGSTGQAQTLTYKCKTSAIPSSKVNTVAVELHGVKKQEAGNAAYDHTMTATFMETVDYATLAAFRQWRNYMRSWRDNTGTDSAQYKVNLEMDLYDNAGNVARTVILVGSFPTDIAEVPMSGSEANAVEISITFSFDNLSDSDSW